MKQFRQFKGQFPDCVLFFRMGDFYEMFYEDAKLANKTLGVTLTQRTEGIPMAGVPYHAVEGYMRRMIQAGYRVAVCDQVEDPAQAKGVVRRDVTRVITPGTLTDESLLDEGKGNPLAAVMYHDGGDGGTASVAWVELSTGSFQLTTLAAAEIADELARIAPSELLHVETADGQTPERIVKLVDSLNAVATARPAWQFRQAEAVETLLRQFQVATLAGFGFDDTDASLGPAGAVVQYLLETQKGSAARGDQRIAHLLPPRRFSRAEHMVVDQVSLRSLEVERTIRSGSTEGSLLGVLQNCVTAMGKRMLRQWLCYPLADRTDIEQRQRIVGAIVEDSLFRQALRKTLGRVQDVQRMIGRIAVGRAMPRDLVGLGLSVTHADALAELLADRPAMASYADKVGGVAQPLGELADTIHTGCVDAPPAHLREGGLIRDGYDKALDEYRTLQHDSNSWLAGYQKELIEQTGISSLKVGYNRVFGYYIEVTAAHRDKAPDAWSRKQTLKNAERYITPQLKEYEGKVLSARSRAIAREQDLFAKLCDRAQRQLADLHAFAEIAAELDVLACFADRAARARYVKPTMVDEPVLQITAGRHPVLDELLGDQFVPNEVELGAADKSAATLALITGPNMAGKSTYIRQTALIVLLAHTGSFVPADAATIGICDRIFTRIGASDELHAGQSTFMVEMTETANICHHATESSLVILDEIGRGTSTLDGLSLAWALAEFIAQRRCRCLFATHYHEITRLAEQYPAVRNLNVTVREWQDQIVFLHRIVPGATDRSYGIHVAKIAGLPGEVVDRANDLLAELEVSHNGGPAPGSGPGAVDTGAPVPDSLPDDGQLSLFTQYLDHPVVDELRQADLKSLSPLDAFDLLRRLKRQAEES